MFMIGLHAVPENVVRQGLIADGYMAGGSVFDQGWLTAFGMSTNDALAHGLPTTGAVSSCNSIPMKKNALGTYSLSGGLGCCSSCAHGGSCKGRDINGGLGDLSTAFDNITNSFTTESIAGFPVWMLAGGAALLLLLMSSRGSAGSGYKAAKAEAKAKYQRALRDADENYGRRYKRYGRAALEPLGF